MGRRQLIRRPNIAQPNTLFPPYPVAHYDMVTPGAGVILQDRAGRHPANLVNGPLWTPRGINLDGVNDYIDTQQERLGSMGLFAGPAEKWTVVVAPRAPTTVTNKTMIARARSAVDGVAAFYLRAHGDQAWTVCLRDAVTLVGPSGTNTGAWHVHVVRWNGVMGQYRRDTGAWQPLSVGIGTEDAGQRIVIGAAVNGASGWAAMDADYALLYDRDLTDYEADWTYNSLTRIQTGRP